MSSVGRRRTPGLRREEVAVLAGVGVSWYTWLEQGRDITVSAEVLDAVARALLLNAAERGHLYLLVGLNPPPAGELGGGAVTPQVRQLLDAWEQRPALLRDRYWNVLACNDDGKIALITGGTSGIGLATARRLLAEGAQVVITGRDRTRLNEVAEELGDRVLGIAGDAANLTDLETLTAAIRDRHGRLDVVFANAGTGAFQAIDEVTEDEFHRVVDINLKSVFFTVQKSLPLLPDGAAIVVNASFALHRGAPDAALYTATKAAVHTLARTFAAELAPRGIRVSSVSPGYIDTPAFRTEAQAAAAGLVAAGRVGTAEEVAAVVAFLASKEASYVNGQDLLVDGGLINVIPAAML